MVGVLEPSGEILLANLSIPLTYAVRLLESVHRIETVVGELFVNLEVYTTHAPSHLTRTLIASPFALNRFRCVAAEHA